MLESLQRSLQYSGFKSNEKSKVNSYTNGRIQAEPLRFQHQNVDSHIKMIENTMQTEIEADEKKFRLLKSELTNLEQMLKDLNLNQEVFDPL